MKFTRGKRKITSHIAEWLMSVDNATRVQVLCEEHNFFFVLLRLFTLTFVKKIFAWSRRYPLGISTAKGVIDHADSEYAVFIDREHFL
jgi:hypothetical protein